MDGLLGNTQSQGQRQGNLLGGVFQSPSSVRRQERNSLFNNVLAVSQAQDPFSASAAMGGAQIGLGLGRALGFETQGDRTARIIEQVQNETLESGLDPNVNPEETFRFIADRFQQLGAPDLALQALQQRSQFGPKFGDFQTFYGPNGEMVEARFVTFPDGSVRLESSSGQDLTGFNLTSSQRAKTEPIKVEDIPVRFPDGTTGTAFNVPGMMGLQIVRDGQYVNAPVGTTQLTSATQTPERTTGPTDEDWRQQVATTQELVDTSSRIKDILSEEGASVIGFLGSTNRFLASVGAQGRALLNQATVFDENTGQSSDLRVDNFEDALSQAGFDTQSTAPQAQRILTNALRLAYLAAKSSDPSGRVSDADFRAALNRIGGSTGNPASFIAALQEEARNAVAVTVRNSGNFLDEAYTTEAFIEQELENQRVNTGILEGLDFGTSPRNGSQEVPETGQQETPPISEIIENAEDTRVIDGVTYYQYNGEWYTE